ncbi:MAG: helix-turn-helix domain-containing protein [Rhodocyclaceae bacterium]
MPPAASPRHANGEFAVIDLSASRDASLILIDKLMLIEKLIALDRDARIVILTARSGIAEAAREIGRRPQRYLVHREYAGAIGLLGDTGQEEREEIGEDDAAGAIGRSSARVEWEHIQRVLAFHQGNKTAAAATLKINLSTLKRKLSRPAPAD